ncbi:peptidyl-prolyl cis-trans isomerase [Mycobacteroides abscessus subsp. abscessus]|uniref:Peptidyl-prolyl cis-trans isomerase n=1 Tax=Gordonia jacobaea TaxID=122202 RepID=A0ABR5IHX6_9ACTN|nr:peptidylprolyl isomerase [Gordonia jacobaea]SKX70730.1 peptidyl-prolyl cis-trans isomerase [Mycobacteroides abscessus subsp. abscessus]
MTPVNIRRVVLPVAVASLTIGLAACGSDSGSDSAASSSTSAASPSCPSAAPAADAKPDWTLRGTTGSVDVVASTSTTAPAVTVTTPFAVEQTQVHTLREGSGEVVPDTATVSVCYVGVDGRDGKTFDSSYSGGTPVQFPLDRVVVGFKKAIAGQKVGSSVAVAMNPEDGYPNGNPAAGINKGDSLVFELTIVSVDG